MRRSASTKKAARSNGIGRVQNLPNIRRAEALVQIGQHWLAEELLKHQRESVECRTITR